MQQGKNPSPQKVKAAAPGDAKSHHLWEARTSPAHGGSPGKGEPPCSTFPCLMSYAAL